MDAMNRSIARRGATFLVLIGSTLFLEARSVAQVSDQASAEDRAKIEAFLKSSEGVASDPTAVPPPPDDPNERDLAKRKRFLWELGRGRIGGALLDMGSLKPASDAVTKEEKTRLLTRWSTLLANKLRPVREEEVRWYGLWVHSRDGARLNWIVAEWSAAGFLVRASASPDNHRYVPLLIRFPNRADLQFRARPPDTDTGDTSLDRSDWEYVPTTGVRRAVGDLFVVPNGLTADFRVRGQSRNCAGVEVFTAEIALPNAGGVDQVQTSLAPESILARILITDSDPQYLCLTFDLSQDAPVPGVP